jgi:hypothetical protein
MHAYIRAGRNRRIDMEQGENGAGTDVRTD